MGKDKENYGVILDAGSSGTRVYIYRWLDHDVARLETSSLGRLPALETKEKWTKKVHPGVSTFGETPSDVGPGHLKKLLEHALEYVPKEKVPDTPFFLLATAGMRLLPDAQQKAVLDHICRYVKTETEFLLPDCDLHVQIIPGQTEGLYGWLAANYLLGGFDDADLHDHGKGHHTYGFLDMGGASAQIAFAPNATEAQKHANDLTLLRLRTMDGASQEHRVFVTTWLGFGANQARRRYVEELEQRYLQDSILEIPDPCLPHGVKETPDGTIITDPAAHPSKHYLLGTGKFDECLRRTFPLLEKDVPCPDEPCLLHGVHTPAIDFDVNHFIGVSEYWHTTHEIFEMAHKDKSYDFNTYQQRVAEFCSMDWADIQKGIKDKTWGKKVEETTALEVCFKASWLINMLHDGIGIPRIGLEDTSSAHNGTSELLDSAADKGFLDPFQAVNKIKSTEVSWTMGKMILYASAAIPPLARDALPVGFGSNVAGVPDDFQFPGGGRLQPTSQSLTSQFRETLFNADAPHRLPGFLFFLLILVILVFYLCGRERRGRLWSSLLGSPPGVFTKSRPSFFASILNRLLQRPRPGRFDYARDVEGGATRLYDPSSFELDAMEDSDSDELDPNDAFRMSPSKPPVRDKRLLNKPGPETIAGRLTPDLDRRGLVVRTESREQLGVTAMNNGRSKSRNGSPTRPSSRA